MKRIMVATLGRLCLFLWRKFRNLRALAIKREITHGDDFMLIDPGYLYLEAEFVVGNRVFINANLSVIGFAKIEVGDDVMFGPNVTLLTSGHDPDLRGGAQRDSKIFGPILIGAGSWIGANAVILPNVTIGENSVIGAGSLVNRDIPPGVIAAGNPCRVIREKKDQTTK